MGDLVLVVDILGPFLPAGDARVRIEAGDFVIVMALRDQVRKVEQMFRVSIDFF